jgi:DNA-directed RNA polymerase specialized sigma24 family protein
LKKKRRFRSAFSRAKFEFPGEVPAPAVNPGRKKRLFQELLNRLNEKERAALTLWVNEGFTSFEIAGVLGCSASTARVHLYNSRKKLRSILEKNHATLGNY